MISTRRPLLAAVVFALLASPAAIPALAAETPYLTAKQLDLIPFLPPPPTRDSARDRAEMGEVLALQTNRSPERAAQAEADSVETVYAMFAPVLGPGFTAEKLPKADALFGRVAASENEVLAPVKRFFARPRPFMASDAVKPAAVASRSFSYPSGHVTRGTLMGIILAAMLPEKREALWARVEDYAASRAIGGVHYRSDIEGGKRAGTAIAGALFEDPAFRADFESARAELRHALGL